MLRQLIVIQACILLLLQAVIAIVPNTPRVLVVHENGSGFSKSDYSAYFKALEAQGLQLTFRKVDENKPYLYNYEEAAFDHLLLFAPTAKSLPTDLAPQKLVNFLQQNGNILFALSSELSELYRDLAREFELEIEDRGTSVVDHFLSLQNDETHTQIAIPNSYRSPTEGIFAGIQDELPFLFKGVAHRLGSNPLAFPILKAPSTAYSFELPSDLASIDRLDNPDREAVLGSDEDVALISAFQLLDTNRRDTNDGPKRQGSAGRAVFVGSLEAFSDKFTRPRGQIRTRDGKTHKGSSNLAILSAITSWLTQQQGVLRVEQTSHSRVKEHEKDVRESYEELDIIDEHGERRLQRMYRIKDTVTFNIDLVQRTPKGWLPAPTNLDLQLSLVMLDPYITTNLTAQQPSTINVNNAASIQAKTVASSIIDGKDGSARATRYSSTIKLPDRHGVYTFIVDWKRHGWSYIHTRDTSPVRPFNHDEHPRGLHSAWPYVVGATSTAVAFLLFCVLWICTQEDERSAEEKQRKDE